MGNPSMNDDFTNHITNGKWRTNKAFAQRRLAGVCPFTLRKVIREGQNGLILKKLLRVMNPGVRKLIKNFGKVS